MDITLRYCPPLLAWYNDQRMGDVCYRDRATLLSVLPRYPGRMVLEEL